MGYVLFCATATACSSTRRAPQSSAPSKGSRLRTSHVHDGGGCRYPRHRHVSGGAEQLGLNGEKSPGPRDALESVLASLAELDSRPHNQVLDRPRYFGFVTKSGWTWMPSTGYRRWERIH